MQRLDHGFTNETQADDTTVIKRYVGRGADARFDAETRCLEVLAGIIAVPALLGTAFPTVRVRKLQGVHGKQLIDSAYTPEVMVAMAETLLAIHALPIDRVDLPGAGKALVHGDYGPQNLLFSPSGDHVVGVLDWEWAHLGEPIEDLVTVEWIVRTHHPKQTVLLMRFFDAYGIRPAWADRQTAIVARCRRFAESDPVDRGGAGRQTFWAHRARIAAGWCALPGE